MPGKHGSEINYYYQQIYFQGIILSVFKQSFFPDICVLNVQDS